MSSAWGNDPVVSGSKTASPHDGWGNDPLVKARPEDLMTDAQKMAKATAPSGGDLARFEGLTFGFGDEAIAGLSAGLTGLSNIGERMAGGKPKYTAGEAYDATLNQERMNMSQYESEHPIASFANELFGGALNPLSSAGGGLIKGAETSAGRVGRTALVGAAGGSVAGFGSGKGDDFLSGTYNRLKNALGGAVGGAAFGAGAGTATEAAPAIGRGLQAATKAFRSIFHSFSGKTPEEALKSMKPEELKHYQELALNYVEQMITGSGKKVEDLTKDPAHLQGKPVTGAEASGRVATNQLASIGRRGGTTGDVAESQFRQRGEERGARVQENLAKAASLDVKHTQGHMDDLSENLRERNKPLYDTAYSQPPVQVMKDPVLKGIFARPSVRGALVRAAKIAAEEGRPFPDINNINETTHFNWQDLDTIKRGLGVVINREHKNAVGKLITDDESRPIIKTVDALRDRLFKLNPQYEKAVGAGGEPIQLEQSYEGAAKLMDSRTTEHQFHKLVEKMTPAQIEATKSGWVNDIYNKLQKDKLQPKDLKTPEFLGKARRLLGETQARQFVDEIQQELRLKANEQRIPPGRQSITGELKEASSEADAQMDEQLHSFIGALNRRGSVSYAVIQAVNDAWYKAFQAAKTPEREVMRNEVGKLLLMKPDQLQAELEKPRGPAKDPKVRELGQMIYHLTGPGAAAATEGTDQ